MDADMEVFPRPRPDVLREARLMLDEVDVGRIFNQRAAVIKSVPHCLKGPFRTALELVFEQIFERINNDRSHDSPRAQTCTF